MRCPNVLSPEWKALKAKYGLKNSIYLYDMNGQDIPSLEQAEQLLKNRNFNDPLVNEALMSEDNELSNFIMDTLKKEYPGIKIFNSKKDFTEFVNKNGGDMDKVSIDAIGHAFQNVIYIDEENALQSTYFHENAHIYWDALSDTNPIKKALLNLFGEEGISGSEIEESIIKNIGIAGVDIAKTELRGNKLERFQALLKQFWANVKNLLGFASQKDLINIMAQNVWENKEKFNEKNFINHIVKSMDVNPYNILQDDVTRAFKYGDRQFTSVTRAIGMFSVFNPDEAANAIYNRLLRQKEQNDDDNVSELDTFEKREEFIQLQKERWNRQAEVGSGIHKIAELIVRGKNIDEISESFIDGVEGEKIKDLFNEDILERTHAEIERIINNWKSKGWTVYSEAIIGSVKHGVAGIADVILEKDGKLAVLDFKSFFEDDKSERRTGRFLRFPLETMEDTKANKHQLQVDVLSNMLEEQENKDVLFTAIVPLIYEIENNKVSSFTYDNEQVKIQKRKSRKSKIKDRKRKHGNVILNYVQKVNESREEKNKKEKKANQNLPKDFSKDLAEEQIRSAEILSQFFGDLDNVPVEYIERILQVGLESMTNLMQDTLGYDYDTIFGNPDKDIAPMTAKEVFLRYFNRIKVEEDGTVPSVDFKNYDIDEFKTEVLAKQSVDFPTTDADQAYKMYKAELNLLEEIYDELGDVSGIQKMKVKNLNEIYKKVINMSSLEGRQFKEFLEDLKVSKLLSDRLKEENKDNYYGIKYATLYLGRTIISPDRIFTDLKDYAWYQQYFKNIMRIGDEHILVNILAAELYNEHRMAVRDVENMKINLEAFINDTYDKKNKKDRKQLKNEDFDDIIYTDEKTGFKKFMIPSEARKTLEEKYGKDDPRPRNMARYISSMTNIMIENDGIVKAISKKRQPRINVPELQASVLEILMDLPLNKKHLYHKIYNLFSIKPYDSKTIRINGEEKQLIDVKSNYYKIIQEKIESNQDITNELNTIESYNNTVKKEYKEKERKRKSKNVYVIGKQTGRTILKTKNYNSSIQEYLASVMEAKRLERIIPISEYTMKMYTEKVGKDEDIMKFLTREVDKKVYKRTNDVLGDSKSTKDIVNKLIWWTATKTLGANVVSNIRNRFIGSFWNWVKHPDFMLESYKRKFTDFGDKRNIFQKVNPISIDQYKKLGGIMRNTNMGTVMQDATFGKYKSFWRKVNELAFLPLEGTEIYNQGELLRGIITEAEMNAYNSKGTPLKIFKEEILDPDIDTSNWTDKKRIEFENKLEKAKLHPDVIQGNRANELASILASVHGYFGFNKSQWSYYMLGRMFGMYTLSWAQASFEIMYKKKGTDFTGRVNTGLFNSLMLNSKILTYNLFLNTSVAKNERRKVHDAVWENNGFLTRREAEVELYKLDRFADPNEYIIKKNFNGKDIYYVPGLHTELDSFEKILAEKIKPGEYKEGQKIKKEEIDLIDRQNMIRLFIFVSLSVASKMLWYGLGDWDDKLRNKEEYEIGGKKYKTEGLPLSQLSKSDRFKHYLLSFTQGIFGSLVEDATFFTNQNFFLNYFRTPIPLSTIGQTTKGLKDLYLYAKDDPEAYHSNPSIKHVYTQAKYIDQLRNQIPYIAKPLRDVKALKRWFNDDEYKEMLDKKSTAYAEGFRMDVISKAGAYLMMENKEVDYEKLKNIVDKEFKTLKNVYLDYILLEDYKKSKFYENNEYRTFMQWLDIVKQYERESKMEREREYKIGNKAIEQRIKKINEQLNQ